MKRILVKKLFLLVLAAQASWLTTYSQYWQQEVNYTIDVSLNDKDHTLNGFEKIEYINHSPDTLRFIWFHVWPNAYKNDKTAFSDQQLEHDNTKFYFSDKEQKGYINRLDFKVNNITAASEDHPQHIDIIKLLLPSPLPPGQKILITTPFHEKLPYNFSRSGHDGESYQVTQWYPKPAVYDRQGWHPMPYLDQGEFYSEFGAFDVSITVPENYVVAATGELQNASEKEWLKTRSSFTWTPVQRKVKTKNGPVKTVTDPFPPSATTIKILRFKQDRIHDFAWFADKRFIVDHDSCRLASGRVVDVYAYYLPKPVTPWRQSARYAKDAILHYSSLVGEYPYRVVSAVEGPESFGGGMEYPTITVLSPTTDPKDLDYTLAHEIGHNWFYGILGSDERTHAWMDEGINSYYETLYSVKKDPQFSQYSEQEELETLVAQKKDQAIENTSEDFTETNYDAIVYYKTSRWMAWLEKSLGTAVFNKAMQEYYRRWQFKHPQPEDFKKTFEDVSGKNLDSSFALLNQTGTLPGDARAGVAVRTVFKPLSSQQLRKKATIITVLPAPGYNRYDRFMIGAVITNLKLPPNPLQFMLAPMYATGSKKFAGTGFINETIYPHGGPFKKIDIRVSGASFSMDQYTDDDGHQTFLGFHKIVPGIRLTLKEKNPRSSITRFIQFKTFFISEDALRFYRDTVITGIDTTVTDKYRTLQQNRTLNQLQFVIKNERALYPYRGELKIEQGKDFARASFTGNYFFNYGKYGGLSTRLFAGKFFYAGSKTVTKQFNTDRYHLNMTGANGYEDYTYSDYFAGRNEFQGTASQQIMIRDGGFKVRTDLLAEKVGKTDDWLIAVNLSSTLPPGINPMSRLPEDFPVQLKVFADIGTYAAPWKTGAASDKFLFDAGIHIGLLKETVNFYIPLFYSTAFKDYIKSTIPKKNRLLKIMSFSIDISHFNFRKLDRKLDF